MIRSLVLGFVVVFVLAGCASQVVRVTDVSPCDKSFAVISDDREPDALEYMAALEIALYSAGCTTYFSKYAFREVEPKDKRDTGVGTQYDDKDNYIDKDGNKRGGSLDKIYGSGTITKAKVKRAPRPEADYYLYFDLDKYGDVRIVEARSERVAALTKTYRNQDNVTKRIFEALNELGIAHLSPDYDALALCPAGIGKGEDYLIAPALRDEVGQLEYAAAVEGVLLSKGYRVAFFEDQVREVERTVKSSSGSGSSNQPGSGSQRKEKYSGLFPRDSDYVVWTQQVRRRGQHCSILFYDRKTMELVGAVRTSASARNVRKQLGLALDIMAEPLPGPRIEKTSGSSI